MPKDSHTRRHDYDRRNYDKPSSSFNYEDHKAALNRMFFGPRDKICAGTKEYNDFWLFLRKYLQTASKAHGNNLAIIEQMKSTMKEDWMDIDYLMSCKGALFKDDEYYGRSALTKERVTQFRDILLLYLNFMEKKRIKMLEKLQQDKENLPIHKYKQNIIDALKSHSVILIAGDTGCGKSTQVPQYLLESGYTNIVCTQPRRIACISLCKRVSYETQNEFGSQIGYQIRFEKHRTKDTRIVFITEGLLLRQVTSDPMLSGYNVIILDEVHERHLSCDFLLGLMRCLLLKRSADLKVILMSATININLFSSYFGDCPTVEVPGRIYPIELFYYPVSSEDSVSRRTSGSRKINPEPYLRMLKMIDEKYSREERGDMLVFLSGITEITSVAEHLKPYATESRRWIILMLHSSLSLEEQDRVFDIAPEGVRKVILSTNIAETSVTIDGVRFVVDSGKVKEMSFDTNSRMQRLQEFWISKASSEQRKGRAGRTGPGVCYRLYSLKSFEEMDNYSVPEIRRVPLDYLLLRMIEMGLPDVRKFPFLEPPSTCSIEEALNSLRQNSALTESEELTPMGRMLTRLPVDITIGKMLILGSMFNLIEPIISLGACLSVQSPFTLLSYRHLNSIEARKGLECPEGDPFLLLKVYNEWLGLKSSGKEDSRKWCKKRGLEEQRFYEITKLRKQFRDVIKESGLYFVDKRTSDVKDGKPLRSAERIKRHGELKQLKSLKRQLESTGPKKRKVLKVGFDGEVDEDDEAKETYDLKEIDFRLAYNNQQIKDLRSSSEAYSKKDLNLFKVILSSGLYPQMAIPDDFNSFKKDSDQLFHTKNKPFVALHPNSVYAMDPELLRLNDKSAQTSKSGVISTQHYLLAYLVLLETTKPYLCNCLKVQAAHTVLLFANEIDTNADITRLILDKWIELRFLSHDKPENFLSTAIQVRDLWQLLLTKVFEESLERETNDDDDDDATEFTGKKSSPEILKMRDQLNRVVNKFLSTAIPFTIKRLVTADIKCAYIGNNTKSAGGDCKDQSNSNLQLPVDTGSFSPCNIPHPEKGGTKVNHYLTYNCLSDNDISKENYIKRPWQCTNCGQDMVTTLLDEIRHKEKCTSIATGDNDEESLPVTPSSSSSSSSFSSNVTSKSVRDPLAKKYACEMCHQTLHLTPTEIVKHIRSHKVT